MTRLGQHFLKDKNALRRIADALQLAPRDTVVEIGPGHGELTEKLKNEISYLKSGGLKIYAVEKDPQLAVALGEKYGGESCVEVIEGDALKIIPELIRKLETRPDKHPPGRVSNWKLAGNIPYYITGKLLRTIGELEHKPSLAVIMIQKEVAERLVATPPRMNRLAASVQFWAEPKILCTVPRGAFSPPPGVDSAVVVLAPKEADAPAISGAAYDRALRILFSQPRKTIENNLASGLGKGNRELAKRILTATGLSPLLRPQDLSIGDIARIGQELERV